MKLLLFDVIETLFSLQPLRQQMRSLGLTERHGDLFFAQLLRDAFALAATGSFQPFPAIAAGTLEVSLANAGIDVDRHLVKRVMSSFAQLPAHPDVAEGLRQAQRGGARVVLLTNGTATNTRALVERANLDPWVDEVLSIETFGLWKPHPELYRRACEHCSVPVSEACLIAAHAWDVRGALSAGLKGVWVRRQDQRYHDLMGTPSGQADDLPGAISIALTG